MAKTIIETPCRSISELELILQPGFVSRDFSTEDVDLSSPLTRYKDGETPPLVLHNAVISSPMQAVFSPALNVEVARLGGFAISNCSQSIETQTEQRRTVRNRKAGFIVPSVIGPDALISELYDISTQRGYSTFPVTRDGTLGTPIVGMITSRDYDIGRHKELRVRDRMIPRDRIIFASYSDVGEDLKRADDLLRDSHHGSMPVLLPDDRIKYMVFLKDIREHREHPNELVDRQKRFLGGDAINTHDYRERVPALVEAGSTFLYITTSQAFSEHVADTLEFVLEKFPDIPVGAGNIVTPGGFRYLAERGATCVGIGMGPGSTCKTQEQIGVGMAQATAIKEIADARDDFYRTTRIYVPVIGDGGFSRARDFVIGFAASADLIMSGRVFAGTTESPTPVNYNVSPPSKPYWGEGSEMARQWMENRYGHMRFEEGVVGRVQYVGPLKPFMQDFLYAVRDGLRKGGLSSIKDAHANAVLRVMSEAASAEGRPHDLLPSS